MKIPSPRAHLKIRGGDTTDLDYYTIDDLEDEEYDDEYEYYEVDDDDDEDDYEDENEATLPEVPYYDIPPPKPVTGLSSTNKNSLSSSNPIILSLKTISGTAALLPNLSTLQRNLISNGQTLSVEIVKFLSLHAYASASIGGGILSLLLLQIVLGGRKVVFPGGGRLIKLGRSRRKSKTKTKQNNNNNNNKYGDYSKGYYPEDTNEDVVDLDETKKIGVMKRYWNKVTDVLVPNALVYWFQNVGIGIGSMKDRMGMKLASASSFFWTKHPIVSGEGLVGDLDTQTSSTNVDKDTSLIQKSEENEPTSSLRDAERVEELQHQLTTLTDSHQSLEQEYEASLRMLHEARLELRQLKSKITDDDGKQSQKEQMEAAIKTLEDKYKQQMKDQIERIRNQTTEKIRAELVAEYDEKFRERSEQLDAERKQYEEDFLSSSAFQQYVDEASAERIEEAVANAVEETIEQQQAKSREEMARIREAIQKVLERERRMMKEQVAKATSQVREWVKRQQLEQLQRREEQLRGEARELGLLEEEQMDEREVDVSEDDEDVAMAGDVVDRRMVGRRQPTPRRSDSRERERYTGSSLYEERRRGLEERRRSASRSSRREGSELDRGNYYPEQAEEYDEDDVGAMSDEDDGTSGDVDEDMVRQRTIQRPRQPSRYTSTNIYKEAAKRKQQRRQQGM